MFKKEKIKDLHYSINGVLSAAEIQTAADEILAEYGKKAKMPGFRTGHIPLSTLRQKFGQTAYAEAVDKLLNADMQKFAQEKELRLAGAPKADIPKVEVGADVEFSLDFDVLPKLPEFDLEKFNIVKKVASVPDSEIDLAINNLRKSRAQALKQDDKYKAENGDVAVIDFKGFLGDEAFEGGEAKKHHLTLGSNSFIPGFEEKIVGHKAGDEFDIKVKFPKEYHSEKLAGKDAKFEIKVHEVRKYDMPEMTDELAKEVGQESVEKLRSHIKEILENQYSEASKSAMREEVLELLSDKVKLDLPEVLVQQEFDMARREQEAKGIKFDDKKERKDAERRVKLGLILAEWGQANKVEVTQDDLQKAIWAEAARYPNPQQVFEFYGKNQNALTMLRGMIFERKSLDAMIEKVKIKEKTVAADELFKQPNV